MSSSNFGVSTNTVPSSNANSVGGKKRRLSSGGGGGGGASVIDSNAATFPQHQRPLNDVILNSSSQSLLEMETERTNLRSKYESLFEQRLAISRQMKEIEGRLQWLDEEIDRVDEEQKRGIPLDKFGNRIIMGSQIDSQGGNDHVENDRLEGNEFGRPGRSQNGLTLGEIESDPIEDDEAALRRVSNSPPFGELNANSFLSRSSTNPSNDQIAGSHNQSRTALHMEDIVDLSNNEHSGIGDKSNPYQDLWIDSDERKHCGSKSGRDGIARKIGVSSAGGGQNNNPHSSQTNQSHYPWTERMMHHLRNTFHISNFRDHQEDIINATLSGQDAFVIMRTGGGKSLTYQLPAVLESEASDRKLTIVISPLISLIRDQEDQMNEMISGSAMSFTSGMAGGNSEHARRWRLVRDPNAGVALIFVTPEKVHQSAKFRGEMEKLHNQGRLGRFVIDECHCACQWGHDFRKDYTKLGILKLHFPSVPVLAVTATASERVRSDCADILRLGANYRFFRSSANRPNLNYSVVVKRDSKDGVVKDMVEFIKEHHDNQAGIIYTFKRQEADDVADKLCDFGIVARSYHSGVPDAQKDAIHKSWMRNDTQVVVATIAFGLGINKPDVRFVLHHSVSKSLEAYYQESGRAGRDGQPASCVLYYSPKDVPRMLSMIHGESCEPAFWGMVRYGQAHGDDALCRHAILTILGEADAVASRNNVLEDLKNRCTTTEMRDIGSHAKTVTNVVHVLSELSEPPTLNQIVTKWRSKSDDSEYQFLKDNPPAKDLNKEECERVVVALLVEDVLHPKLVYTPYNTICYITLGPKGYKMLCSENPTVYVSFPIRVAKARVSLEVTSAKKSSKSIPSLTKNNGWVSRNETATKPKAKPRRQSFTAKKKTRRLGRRSFAKSSKSTTKSASRKSKTQKKSPVEEIVEVPSSSDDEAIMVRRKNKLKNNKKVFLIDSNSSGDESDFSPEVY